MRRLFMDLDPLQPFHLHPLYLSVIFFFSIYHFFLHLLSPHTLIFVVGEAGCRRESKFLVTHLSFEIWALITQSQISFLLFLSNSIYQIKNCIHDTSILLKLSMPNILFIIRKIINLTMKYIIFFPTLTYEDYVFALFLIMARNMRL